MVFLLFSLCKLYLPLWLAVLAVPACRNPRWRLAVLAGALVLGVVAVAAWAHGVRDLNVTIMPEYDPARQWAMLRAQPLHVGTMLLNCLKPDWVYVQQVIGVLGWLNLWLPLSVYVSYVALLSVTACLAGDRPPLAWRARLLMVAVCLLLHVGIFMRAYLYSTGPGDTAITGVQGRYFLPYLPMLLLIPGCGIRSRMQTCWQRFHPVGLPLLNGLLLIVCTLQIAMRFYGP